MSVFVEERGSGDRLLVLLHGMACTGAVWRRAVGALDPAWDGRIVVVDLPGHGASAPLPEYTYDTVAAAVAEVIPTTGRLVVVGHSFGGAIAALLGSGRFGVAPEAVVAAGVKVSWTDDELAGAAAIAAKPARWFATREEAEERYRKVAGLVDADPLDIARGVIEVDGQFRLAADPRAGGIGAPDMTAAVRDSRCPVVLCRGERDHMVSAVQLGAVGVPSHDIAGAGHNVHVERPDALAQLIRSVTPG